MKYKAVGFDYGGVIGGVTATHQDFEDKVCRLLNIDRATYRELYFSLNHKINLGEVATWREFWTLLLGELGQTAKLEELMMMNDEVARNLLIIDPAMPLLVDTVRSLGFKTGLLSNATLENGAAMRKQGLDDHFDVFHISAETGLMKPQPAAFRKLADELDVDLKELIFIDDAEKSLSSAVECGFTPILFQGREALIRDLRSLGVAV